MHDLVFSLKFRPPHPTSVFSLAKSVSALAITLDKMDNTAAKIEAQVSHDKKLAKYEAEASVHGKHVMTDLIPVRKYHVDKRMT